MCLAVTCSNRKPLQPLLFWDRHLKTMDRGKQRKESRRQ